MRDTGIGMLLAVLAIGVAWALMVGFDKTANPGILVGPIFVGIVFILMD